MRVCYQPTQDTPSDWIEVQSDAWAGLPSFTCHALCVQGVVFDGADHYSVEQRSPGVVDVVVWHDDPSDWPPGQRWARVWTFRHLRQDPDPRFGGAVRPQHQQVIYAENGVRPVLKAAYGSNPSVSFRPWRSFDSRRVNAMHGAWVTDEQHADQQKARSVQGWRTWTEGLSEHELDANGHVKVQRRMARYQVPRGTRTYYHNTNPVTTPINADYENGLGGAPTGAVLQTSGNVGTNGADVWSTITVAGEPDSAAWPTTGEYRYQLDVTAAGSDLTFGLLAQGNGDGHFSRISADGTTNLQTIVQDQSAFAGSGLFIASVTDPSWTPGAATDRYGFAVAGIRVIGHGNQTLTMQLGEADDFTDGPWAAAPAPLAGNATFFGTSF